MLVIRTEQKEEFEQQIEDNFVEQLARDLRVNQPEKTAPLTDEALRDRVRYGVRKARRYGMNAKYPIAMFVELMFIVTPDFDEYPPVNFILKNPEIAPNDRIDRVIAEMSEAHWKNARRRSDQDWESEMK